MLNDSKMKLVTILLLLILVNEILCFKIPDVTFKVEPKGFSLSIPDQDGIAKVDFQVKHNQPFVVFAQGDESGAASLEGNLWTAHFKKQLDGDDLIYVWYNVQHGQVLYRKIQNEPISVRFHSTNDASQQNLPTITKGAKYKGELIFEDDFKTFDEKKWKNEVRFPAEDGDNELTAYYKVETPITQGVISLKLQSLSRQSLQKYYVNRMVYDLKSECNFYINKDQECKTPNNPQARIRKWGGPRINTYDSFSFIYGKVEIRAKFPIGQWIVPTMVLEPKEKSTKSFEHGQLRVGFIRGNDEHLSYGGKRLDGHSLFGGAVISSDAVSRFKHLVNKVDGTHFGEDFHIYTMIWTKTNITFEVDNEPYGTIQLPIHGNTSFAFDQERYIALGISAGGFSDFAVIDSIHWEDKSAKAVHNFESNEDKWSKTWTNPELLVDYVRVYAV